MNFNGFWLPWRLRNLYFMPFRVPWIRSDPLTWVSRQTFVMPTAQANLALSLDQWRPERGLLPSIEK